MVFKPIFPHERANARAVLPLLAGYLISADVKERIGKQRGHLADECVQKLISGFARRVHGRIEHAPVAFDLIRPGRTGKLRIAQQPTGGVAGNIELGHHANAAVARVRDHIANLLLRVVKTIGAELLQLRKTLALDAKTLVVGEVPMEDVQLHGRHAVQIALDHFDGHPVPRDIQMQAAPGKARMILNVDNRRFEAFRDRDKQLSKCFQASQHAQRIRGRKARLL